MIGWALEPWRLNRYLVAILVAALLAMVWFARWAPAEVAFEVSLRERVPKLESEVKWLRERSVMLPPEDIQKLIRLLEAEAKAREKGR